MGRPLYYRCFLICVLSAFACDDDAKDKGDASTQEEGGIEEGEDKDGGEPELDADIADAAEEKEDAAEPAPPPKCPDGIVHESEECDDGNLDDMDGCTVLCEYSCRTDMECDDLDPCNGEEICTDKHACDLSAPELPNGESCGDDRICWEGICLDEVCGDGKKSKEEECDDGDNDPDNGCNLDCEYSCDDDEDCENKDSCMGEMSCDPDEHMCTGDQLDDETECEMVKGGKEGWCQRGVCVPFKCGNGEKELNEECDEGSKNGTEETECSIDCLLVKCGSGRIEGDEECDDGNQDALDGCSPDCKWEFAMRINRIDIVKGQVPEFCYYKENRFGQAYANEVLVGGFFPYDPLRNVNAATHQKLNEGDVHILFHLMDSKDKSMTTVDDDITIGIYNGATSEKLPLEEYYEARDEYWEKYEELIFEYYGDAGPPEPEITEDGGIIMPPEPEIDAGVPPEYPEEIVPLDFPFKVMGSSLNKNNEPTENHYTFAEQRGGGRVITKEPTTIALEKTPQGKFDLYKYMARFEYQVDDLSTPDVEQEVADSVKLPETFGIGSQDSDSEDYIPNGTYCGALKPYRESSPMTPETEVPLTSAYCCKADGSGFYQLCEDDVLTDKCDSNFDVLKQGCWVCLNLDSFQADCSLYDPDASTQPYCLKIIDPIEFDVDTDGDGEYDAWSSVFAFEGTRVRLDGVEK